MVYNRRMWRWCLPFVLIALASCGGEDKCKKVTCSPGRVCEPERGTCVAVDAGQ